MTYILCDDDGWLRTYARAVLVLCENKKFSSENM